MSYFGLNWQFNWASRHRNLELTAKELDRLSVLFLWQQSKDVQLACQTFGLSRATLYRWRKRFHPQDVGSVKEHSRRPHRLRQP